MEEQDFKQATEGLNKLLANAAKFYEEKAEEARAQAEAVRQITQSEININEKNYKLSALATIAATMATTYGNAEGLTKSARIFEDSDELLEYKAKALKILKEL